jgi:hypothetical protein
LDNGHEADSLTMMVAAALHRSRPLLSQVWKPRQRDAAVKPESIWHQDLRNRNHFGAALLHATGSPERLEQLQFLAVKNGMRIELDGLHRRRSVLAAKQEDIYRALGLPFIEPELAGGRACL